MSMTFEIPVYGFGKDGLMYQTQIAKKTIASAHRTGGKIFFIDIDSTGATYKFYNQYGAEISDVRVGDSPYAYEVIGTPTKDKFYVFNEALATSKKWTYQENGSWVYNSLGTSRAVGFGKSNTATVMAADEGKYVSQLTGGDTIWAVINRLRTSVEGGCNDWFVPSKDEVDKLRLAVDRDGDPLVSWFTNNYIWSSSESSATYAWYWYYNGQGWPTNDKYSTNGVFGVRAF